MRNLLTAALLFTSGAACATDAVLVKVLGKVTIQTVGSKAQAPAKDGDSLIFGDAVRTGRKSLAHVVFPDGDTVLLNENTILTLKGTPQKKLMRFWVGEFLIGLKRKLGADESFRVKTPAAVAAARGTLFWGKTTKDKTTTYAGFGSEISVTAKGKTVVVKAGQTVTVPFGQAPSAVTPHSIPAAYAKNFAIDGSLQDLETLVEPAKP